MNRADQLAALKADLQIMTDKLDETLLLPMLDGAKSMISREGIKLDDSAEDGLLTVMYAAYLYRKRKGDDQAMPRMLRYALNNRLFSQKARGDTDG